jgi:IS30 family transposase
MHTNYRHLGLEEREVIDKMNRQGLSVRQMARVLSRSPSTISRELRRNSSVIYDCYMDHRAQYRANNRRSKASRRMRLKNDKIREYVACKLGEDWSPEQISGRLEIDHPGLSISHEAIYQYIYHPSTPNREEIIACLRRSHRRRKRKGNAPRKHKPKIPNRVGIEDRPPEVEARDRFGDWEGDTMISRQSKAALLTIAERKSRLVQLEKLEAKTAPLTSKAVIKRLRRFPKDFRKTITFDNGTEHADHEEITKATHIKCFFCDTYSAWQRGANEHINGLIRQYLPKKTDFATITVQKLKWIESRLNNRPRKCLGFKTPMEVASDTTGIRNLSVALQCGM